MSTTVHVANIAHETSEKEVRDFFSFCGKITHLSITPTSGEQGSQKSASVTFEKETAAKTALLLDNTQLGKSQVSVRGASSIDQIADKAGAATGTAADSAEGQISQEDKPRSRIVAEYLAQGYTLSDTVISKAINLDKQSGFSSRFNSALQSFDSKYKATEKARATDEQYKVTDKASIAWNGIHHYFEQAMGTPTGRKLRGFYLEGNKQVMDVHNEARRLADLKAGKVHEPHPVQGSEHKTTCSCGGEEGACGCAPGECRCATCPRNEQHQSSYQNAPEPVRGIEKTVCNCGGSDGVCGCAPGKCGCANCGKSTSAATTEVKEAAQASGQHLPEKTFGVGA